MSFEFATAEYARQQLEALGFAEDARHVWSLDTRRAVIRSNRFPHILTDEHWTSGSDDLAIDIDDLDPFTSGPGILVCSCTTGEFNRYKRQAV